MTTRTWVSGAAVLLAVASGCVQRTMTIKSDPPGAKVIVNNREIGAAPVDMPTAAFEYYGYYDIVLIKDGYEPLRVRQHVPAPWYGYPVLDFFAENVIPWNIKDHRSFEYGLQPILNVPSQDLMMRAQAQRERAMQIGPVAEQRMPSPPAVSPAPVTPPLQVQRQ